MPTLFSNNSASTLGEFVSESATTLTLAAGTGNKFPSPAPGEFFFLTLTNPSQETDWEIVKVTARAEDVLTVERGQDDTFAKAWSFGDLAELRITKAGINAIKLDAMTNPAFVGGYTETVYTISGTTPALSPGNGSVQTWTLTGASTPTAHDSWVNGQSITLMVDDGSAYSIIWTSLPVTWKTGSGLAPSLNTTNLTAIQLWKVGGVIYGARVGNA